MRAALHALLALGAGAAAVGCILVTGGTSGYTAPDSGGTTQGGLIGEACNCISGQVCCLPSLDAGLSLPTCQASCSEPWQRLCARATDCGDAASAACVAQACTLDDASVQVLSCGPIPICAQ